MDEPEQQPIAVVFAGCSAPPIVLSVTSPALPANTADYWLCSAPSHFFLPLTPDATRMYSLIPWGGPSSPFPAALDSSLGPLSFPSLHGQFSHHDLHLARSPCPKRSLPSDRGLYTKSRRRRLTIRFRPPRSSASRHRDTAFLLAIVTRSPIQSNSSARQPRVTLLDFSINRSLLYSQGHFRH